MSTIHEMLERWLRVDVVKIAGDVINEHKQEYLELNRDQMLDGLNAEGKDIHPDYYEDPYFEGNREHSEQYIEWKQEITPNPRRKRQSPNLYINGTYHSSLDLRIVGDSIEYTSHWVEGPDIDLKYKNIRGLSPLSLQKFREKVLNDEVITEIAFQTGCY